MVEAEIVNRLPDLVIHQAYIFTSGPRRGELFIWVRDTEFRSSIIGNTFRYEVVGQRLDGTFNASTAGTATLATGSSAFIDIPGSDFRLPFDGGQYEVTIEINPGPIRDIAESNYENNVETINWQVNIPAIFAIDSIFVRENCDQRSPGEWALDGLITRDSVNRWPLESASSGYFDTEDNTRYPTDPDQNGLLVFKITNLPLDESLSVAIQFFDCNNLFQGCGEEWREHPFGARRSYPGIAESTLTPENRMRGDLIEVNSRDGDCGPHAFTATYRLMNPDQARDEGYEVDYILPPR